jgi:hypothetical protein
VVSHLVLLAARPLGIATNPSGQYPQVINAAWDRAMNIMSVDDYQAKIEYDAELAMFRGEILGLNGSADFYGRTPEELRLEFRSSLQVFLEVCREKGSVRIPAIRRTCLSACALRSIRAMATFHASVRDAGSCSWSRLQGQVSGNVDKGRPVSAAASWRART